VARDETEEHPNTKHSCYSVVTFDAVDWPLLALIVD
jgi:hypothetical protein